VSLRSLLRLKQTLPPGSQPGGFFLGQTPQPTHSGVFERNKRHDGLAHRGGDAHPNFSKRAAR
jgi:hypothetical protein